MKQGHYTFVNKEDAEEFAKIFNGKAVPDYKYSIHPIYHVWFEYEDKDNIDFIQCLMTSNINLRKKLNESQEHVSVLTQKNNELIDKLNREYDSNRNVNRALESQQYINRTLEYQLDKIKRFWRIKMTIIVDKYDLIDKLNEAFIALSHDYDRTTEFDGYDEFCRDRIKRAIEYYCNTVEGEMTMGGSNEEC